MSFSFRNLFTQDENEDSFGDRSSRPASAVSSGRGIPTQEFEIGELLPFIPPAIVAQGHLPLRERVRIPVSPDGSNEVRLSTIYQMCPPLFAAEITPLNDSVVHLPLKAERMAESSPGVPYASQLEENPFLDGSEEADSGDAFFPEEGSPGSSPSFSDVSRRSSEPAFGFPQFDEADQTEDFYTGSPPFLDGDEEQSAQPFGEDHEDGSGWMPPSREKSPFFAGEHPAGASPFSLASDEPSSDAAADAPPASGHAASPPENPFRADTAQLGTTPAPPREEPSTPAPAPAPAPVSEPANPPVAADSAEWGTGSARVGSLFREATTVEAAETPRPSQPIRPEGEDARTRPQGTEYHSVSPKHPSPPSPVDSGKEGSSAEATPTASEPEPRMPRAIPAEPREVTVETAASAAKRVRATVHRSPRSNRDGEKTEETGSTRQMPTTSFPEMRDIEFRAVFETEETFTARRVCEKISEFEGILACAIVTPRGTVEAFEDERDALGEVVAGLSQHVRGLAKIAGLDGAPYFGIQTNRSQLSFFFGKNSFLAVKHETGAFRPGTREKFVLVARGLDALDS